MGQGPQIKLTLTIHQVKMMEADASQHALTTESEADAKSWRAIQRVCSKALDYAAQRATERGFRPVEHTNYRPFTGYRHPIKKEDE